MVSLKSDENLRGRGGGERRRDPLRTGPTADIASECFYLAFAADDGFHESKMKEKNAPESKSGQEIKIATVTETFSVSRP